MFRNLILFFVITFFFPMTQSWAQQQEDVEVGNTSAKEFIRSCTYGVLAGTLVGAATLAFTDQPGENLNKVARGASLGLYAGIALGLYVVYIVPGEIKEEQDKLFEQQPGLPESEDEYYEDTGFRMHVFPMITQRGIEGVAAQAQLLTF